MKIRVLQPSTKHEIVRQHEALERQLESKRVERLQEVLAVKLTQRLTVSGPRVA